jgi:hypothetical protein
MRISMKLPSPTENPPAICYSAREEYFFPAQANASILLQLPGFFLSTSVEVGTARRGRVQAGWFHIEAVITGQKNSQGNGTTDKTGKGTGGKDDSYSMSTRKKRAGSSGQQSGSGSSNSGSSGAGVSHGSGPGDGGYLYSGVRGQLPPGNAHDTFPQLQVLQGALQSPAKMQP